MIHNTTGGIQKAIKVGADVLLELMQLLFL